MIREFLTHSPALSLPLAAMLLFIGLFAGVVWFASRRRADGVSVTAEDKAVLDDLAGAYDYAGLDTCAACGLCSTACPVGIETGALIRKLRGAAKTERQRWIGQKFVEYLGQECGLVTLHHVSGFGQLDVSGVGYCSSSARRIFRGIAKFAILTVDEQRFTRDPSPQRRRSVDHKQRRGGRQVQRVMLELKAAIGRAHRRHFGQPQRKLGAQLGIGGAQSCGSFFDRRVAFAAASLALTLPG